MAKTYLFWDPLEDNVVREYDEAGTVTAEYTTEPDHFGNVISQRRQGEYRQFHYDGQGSTLVATDENQNVTDTFAYTAFGEVTERTGTSLIPFQYIGRQGYYRDSVTGQYLVRRRPYDPARARWLVSDPVLTSPGNYLYCLNTSLARVDPSGLLSSILRERLENLGFGQIVCDAGSYRNWFDRMKPDEKAETPTFRYYKGPAKGSLESVAGIVVVNKHRPFKCTFQNMYLVAAFEATNVTLSHDVFVDTGIQIKGSDLTVLTNYLTSSTCTILPFKPYVITDSLRIGERVHGIGALAICPIKCNDDDKCAQIGFDSIVFARYLGQYQTRPGQMLLWQVRSCPQQGATLCCINSCNVDSFVTQLEAGYNFDYPDMKYIGPDWGTPHADVERGHEPRPTAGGIPGWIQKHRDIGAEVLAGTCDIQLEF